MSNPDPASSTHSFRVRFCETDLMGIVHHANYLIYCEAGRVDWLHKRGVSYNDWVKLDVQMPIVETYSRFKMAAHFDDVLTMETTMVKLSRVTAKFSFRITRKGDLICNAETTLACVGESMRLTRFPPAIADVLNSPETHPHPSLD